MPNTPLTKSSVVAAFVEGVHDLATELEAWRRFGADVQAFARERGISEELTAFQKAQIAERMAPVRSKKKR